MPAFEMRPLAMPEAELIASWAATPEDVRALTASDEFPLSADHVAAWTYEADFAFTLRRDGDLAAYAEIIEDVVEQDVDGQNQKRRNALSANSRRRAEVTHGAGKGPQSNR